MQAIKKHLLMNARPEDYDNISKLFHSPKTQYFGRHRNKDSLEDLFFNDYVTHRILIPMTITKHIIIGYAEVSNAPNLPALTGDLWPDFIKFHYCCNLSLTAMNTFFLNKFVYHMDYIPDMLRELLSEIFFRSNKLKFIVVLECPDYRRYEGKDIRNYYCLEQFSVMFYPKCYSAQTCPYTEKLHVIMRSSILPKIRYRKALPEDNDDIVGIANHGNPHLKAQLGEYYIAEELLSDGKSLIITTEIDNVTAGFLWLNDNLDLPPLLENYNLLSFGNLLKFNPKERFKEKVLYVKTVQRRPLAKCFTKAAVNEILMDDRDAVTSLYNCSSNLSLTSRQDETVNQTYVDNQKDLLFMRLEGLEHTLKSNPYYVQLQTRRLNFLYNLSDGDKGSWYARSNAFVIQLFGLMHTYDARRIFQFLLSSFAAFPNKDYCLMSVSAGKPVHPQLNEMLKYFIPINSRPKCYRGEHLFITHRAAAYGDISLFAARPEDTGDIINLLTKEEGQSYLIAKRANMARISTIANRASSRSFHLFDSDYYDQLTRYQCDLDAVKAILNHIFEDPLSPYKCFTIRCGDSTRSIDDNKIVGFVIIRPFNLSWFLQKHFHIDKNNELQNFLKAEVVILKLHVFFHFKADFIFRELARQTNYCYFYHFLPKGHFCISNDLLATMQPLEPRRIKRLWFNYLGKFSKMPLILPSASSVAEGNKLVCSMDLLNDHFAVFHTNLRPATYFGSSKHIVILGFNDICKAFLRIMIFNWHNLSNYTRSTMKCLPLLNITVICSNGIMEAEHEHAFKCQTCTEETVKTCWIDFKNSDDFIRDACNRIDVRQWIRFIGGKIDFIDGEQNLIKMKTDCEIYYERLLLFCGTDFGAPSSVFKTEPRPSNYSHINNRFDKILLYHKLELLQKTLSKHIQKSIIVYGCHLRAFEFINFLLKHGVKGSEIHLVIPRSLDVLQMDVILNNSAEDTGIESIVKEMLEDLGVRMYELMELVHYKLHEVENNIKEVTFKKSKTNEEITLQCDLFISFFEMVLPQQLLQIFKASDIEINDDFLLVNEAYETSVPDIYAMGNFIRHKTEPNHQYRYVSPEEAAEKIIHALGLSGTDIDDPKFSKPLYFQAQLPLDYFFVKITQPKRYISNPLNTSYGFLLVTYHKGEFCRVRLNVRGVVKEIVVVTKKKKNYDFLKFFCGHHELLLNNLKSRWYLKEIENLIDFFQEPWTELIMHDEFDALRKINKSLVLKTAEDVVKMELDRVDRRKLLFGYCNDLGITSEMEYAFLEFIRNNREDFSADIALPEDFPRDNGRKRQL